MLSYCLICEEPSAKEYCDSCLTKIKAATAMPLHDDTIQNEPKVDLFVSKRKYYLVAIHNFDTVVDSLDVESFGSIQKAIECRTQPWYFTGAYPGLSDNLMTDYQIKEISHSEYVKWLRS